MKLKIHETARADGALAATHLFVAGGLVYLAFDGEEPLPLPPGAIVAVMERYGSPLEPDARLTTIGALELSGESTLRHVRHLARWDVIARDWLVYESRRGGQSDSLCAMATTVAGALTHLARARARM